MVDGWCIYEYKKEWWCWLHDQTHHRPYFATSIPHLGGVRLACMTNDDARRRETPRIRTTRSPPWPSRARGRHGCSSYAITFSSARAQRTHPSHHGGEEAVLENAPGSAAARRSMRPSDELQAPQQQGRPREEHHGRRRGSAKEKSSFDVDEQLCNKLGHTFSTPIQTFLWKEFF